MTENIIFMEALAHQMRGATIMFFIFLCVLTYKDRKQNRMMQVLFFTFLCLAVGFLKDSIFLSRAMYGNPFIDNMVGIFDVSVMLVVCNFFLEAVRPESTKKPSVWIYPAAELLLIPIYAIFRNSGIVTAAYILGYAAAVGKVIYIMIYAIRHRKYMHNHYSYSDNISLRWVVISCLIYFVSVFIYAMAFSVSTWQSEVLYCVLTITVCSYIIYSALHHKVIMTSEEEETEIGETLENTEGYLEETTGVPVTENIQNITEMIEHKLKQCMETQKLYLNPKLSLNPVAMEIGSNTKYVSLYLNHSLGCTFYDYINKFRVEESCRILEKMTDTGRINMTEVAEMSGFNSVSTFNRYFRSVMGITPKEYYKKCMNRKRTDSNNK